MKRIITIVFLLIIPFSTLCNRNVHALSILATGSGDFTLPAVNFDTDWYTTSTTSIIDDNPTHGDFRIKTTLYASNTAGAVINNRSFDVFFLSQTYDPVSLGQIESIDYTIELDANSPYWAMMYLTLRQDGQFYHHQIGRDETNDGVFTDFSLSGLTEVDFVVLGDCTGSYILSGNPDFGATGGLIEIGLGFSNGTSNLTLTRDQEIQNFSVDLNPVPEPATMLLLGTGLIGLAGVRRKVIN